MRFCGVAKVNPRLHSRPPAPLIQHAEASIMPPTRNAARKVPPANAMLMAPKDPRCEQEARQAVRRSNASHAPSSSRYAYASGATLYAAVVHALLACDRFNAVPAATAASRRASGSARDTSPRWQQRRPCLLDEPDIDYVVVPMFSYSVVATQRFCERFAVTLQARRAARG